MDFYKLTDSFTFAMAGLVHALKTQRNMRIHFTAALLVLCLGLYLRIPPGDMLFLFFAITLVIMAEMFNTAIEAVVDLYVQEFHPLARIAKNVAAGAVVVAALNSLVVAYIVIYPRLEILGGNGSAALRSTPVIVSLTGFLLVMLVVVAGKVRYGRGLPSGRTALAFAGSTSLALLTGSPLVTTIAYIMAFLVVYSSIAAGACKIFEMLTAALLGTLVILFAFAMAGW